MDEHLVDKRVIRRNLEKGKLDPQALRQMLDALPDRSDNIRRESLESAEAPVSAQGAAQASLAQAGGLPG